MSFSDSYVSWRNYDLRIASMIANLFMCFFQNIDLEDSRLGHAEAAKPLDAVGC
jgi:hypothetical protein